MKQRRRTPLVSAIIKKVAPRIGARVVLEPEWRVVGRVEFTSGRKRYFRYSSLDLNTMGASAIAKDKDYATFFMDKMGYSTIEGRTFFSLEWARTIRSTRTLYAAWKYAKRLGMPVIVKPNSGTWGRGVVLAHTKREFFVAIRRAFRIDDVVLVQRPVAGQEYRVVVLDDRVISAYQRTPLCVIGTGKSTIACLLRAKQKKFEASGRDTTLRLGDWRIKQKLKRQGFTMRSVPKRGERVYLLDNANLSTGGDSVDVTGEIHPEYTKLCVDLVRDMGLRLCGVDIMIDGDIRESVKAYWIIEINSAPGLDHYIKLGRAQEKIVENLYLDVLRAMDK